MEQRSRMLSMGAGLEWHAFIAGRNQHLRLVGRVEAVDRDQIWLTRIDFEEGRGRDAEVCISWDDVGCIAVCGPDRDQDLFALLKSKPNV